MAVSRCQTLVHGSSHEHRRRWNHSSLHHLVVRKNNFKLAQVMVLQGVGYQDNVYEAKSIAAVCVSICGCARGTCGSPEGKKLYTLLKPSFEGLMWILIGIRDLASDLSNLICGWTLRNYCKIARGTPGIYLQMGTMCPPGSISRYPHTRSLRNGGTLMAAKRVLDGLH